LTNSRLYNVVNYLLFLPAHLDRYCHVNIGKQAIRAFEHMLNMLPVSKAYM